LRQEASIASKAIGTEQTSVYEMYYDYSEPVRKIPPHRVLALNRGEREEVLKVTLTYPEEKAYQVATLRFTGAGTHVGQVLVDAIRDGCKRLLLPSIERELRATLTEQAEEQAIKVFGQNLKQLLLLAPVKGKTFLAIDPAYRTGCKMAVVGTTGKVLATAVDT
jgi:uncharacterized protein